MLNNGSVELTRTATKSSVGSAPQRWRMSAARRLSAPGGPGSSSKILKLPEMLEEQ
jgi:hypothetical protein